MRYPVWFPYPSCWFKAFLLLILVGSFVRVFARIVGGLGEIAVRLSDRPEPIILSLTLVLLSPIPLIALTHFLLHGLIGRFSPKLQSPQVRQNPALMSLWEGLYGWMAIVLAFVAVISLIAMSPNLVAGLATNQPQINSTLSLVWLTIVACLYQVEALVFLLDSRQVKR